MIIDEIIFDYPFKQGSVFFQLWQNVYPECRESCFCESENVINLMIFCHESLFTQTIVFYLFYLKVIQNDIPCNIQREFLLLKLSLSCTAGVMGYTEHTKQVMYRANKGTPFTLLQPLFKQLLRLHFSECYDYINILKRMVFVLVWPFSAYPGSKSTFVWQPVVMEWMLCTGFTCCEHGKEHYSVSNPFLLTELCKKH